MNILLLGTGYIGLSLLKHWGDSGYSLAAATTTKSKIPMLLEWADEAVLIESNDFSRLGEALEKADVCVITVAPKEGASYEETYLKTAQEVAQAVRGRKRQLHLIYTSSTSVYGAVSDPSVNEETPLRPASANQEILAKAEELYLSLESPLIHVTILRLAGIFGPGRDMAERIGRMVGQALPGTGDEKTNHTHLDDIIGAIDFCLKNRVYGVYNVVMDAHPTRNELYGSLARRLGLPAPAWDPSRKSAHGIGSAVDSSKLKAQGYVFSRQELF